MNKIYKYDNATIIIASTNEINMGRIKTATENFLRKTLVEERNTYGNSNKTGDIHKK